MSVKIRLKRMGSRKRPYYRVVVVDSRIPGDGKTIAEVGYYHPIESEKTTLEEATVKTWLDRGARPTDTVKRLLNGAGITVKQS